MMLHLEYLHKYLKNNKILKLFKRVQLIFYLKFKKYFVNIIWKEKL